MNARPFQLIEKARWPAIFLVGLVVGWWWSPGPSRKSPERAVSEARTVTDAAENVAAARQDAASPTDFFSRLHVALSLQQTSQRKRAIADIATGLDAAQVKDALARLAELHLPDQDEIAAELYARWAELDPLSAMAAAQAIPRPQASRQAVVAVLGSWVESDRAAAEQWVQALPAGPLRLAAAETLIHATAASDPAHALAQLQSLALPSESTDDLTKAIFAAWVALDPQEAATRAFALAAGTPRDKALRTVASRWAPIDLPRALAWAESLPKAGEWHDQPIAKVFEVWLQSDSAAALRWLEQRPREGDMSAILFNIAGNLPSADFNVQMAERIGQMMPEGPPRESAFHRFAGEIAERRPQEVIDWLRAQTDPAKQRMILAGALSRLAGDDLREALRAVRAPDGQPGKLVAQALAGQSWWDVADPATFAEWAIQQPDNQSYLDHIAVRWVEKDAESANVWLQQLAAPAREGALRAILKEALFRVPASSSFMMAEHFQTAERWIAQLSSPDERQSNYENLATLWHALDRDSADAWLQHAPLSPAAKARALSIEVDAE